MAHKECLEFETNIVYPSFTRTVSYNSRFAEIFPVDIKEVYLANFEFLVYPNGRNEKFEGYVSVDLRKSEYISDALYNVMCTVSVVNKENIKIFFQSFQYLYHKFNSVSGIPKFLKRDILLNSKDELLPNDCLTLCFEIVIEFDADLSADKFGSLISSGAQKSMCYFSSDTVTLNWDMSGNCEPCIFPVQLILDKSKVLACVLKYSVDIENVTLYDDVDKSVSTRFYHALFYDKLSEDISMEHIFDLYILADKYDIPTIRNLCRQYFESCVSPEEAIYIYGLADFHSDAQLKEEILKYIHFNFVEVKTSYGWEFIKREKPNLVEEILTKIHHMTPVTYLVKSDIRDELNDVIDNDTKLSFYT